MPVCKAVQAGSSSRPVATRVEKDCLPKLEVMSGCGRFRPANRLNKPADYQELFASGRRTGDRLFSIITRHNTLTNARLGLAISKKNVPLAVRRNRLKRIIRESFRRHQTELEGLDVMVMVKRQINNTNDDIIIGTLDKHWNNVKQ